MKKTLTVALAAVVATTSLGVASAADAQSRHDRREYREQQQAYARWQRAQRRYAAPRYVPPRGYAVRTWTYGERMPAYYRTNAYVVHDYHRYGLRAPPHGYHYVRSGNDVVLAAIAGGLITAVIAGLFQ